MKEATYEQEDSLLRFWRRQMLHLGHVALSRKQTCTIEGGGVGSQCAVRDRSGHQDKVQSIRNLFLPALEAVRPTLGWQPGWVS